uniref:Putative secreted protein n=1 Tax=Anopheles darlingi TaxID=43151 RepID=A0A2M4DMV6_ANODA
MRNGFLRDTFVAPRPVGVRCCWFLNCCLPACLANILPIVGGSSSSSESLRTFTGPPSAGPLKSSSSSSSSSSSIISFVEAVVSLRRIEPW